MFQGNSDDGQCNACPSGIARLHLRNDGPSTWSLPNLLKIKMLGLCSPLGALG